MGKEKLEILPIDKAIGDLLGIIHCFRKLNDINDYRRWMRTYHSLDLNKPIFLGYKYLFNTLLRMLVSNIEHNISLGLSSDEMFDRASFKGESIDKLPNTCDKTIFIKTILKYFDAVIKSDDWDSLNNSIVIFSKSVVSKIEKIRDISFLNPKFIVSDIDTAIDYAAMFQVYIFLNDTSRGLPHGYTSAMVEDINVTLRDRYHIANLDDTFTGYKYAVQYLWYKLLGNLSSDSFLKDIHLTTDWESFDTYFDKIQEKIIRPIEESTKGNIGFDYLILVKDNPRRFLNELLEEPPYEKELTEKGKIQRYFLWYPTRIVNSSEFDFSGVPTLIPLLMGMIQHKRRIADGKSKVKVMRIIHGEDSDHRRDYSYAVLVELYGYISNASGWMLFYDCCSDRGSTSGLFRNIENLISRYQDNDFIDLTSLRIPKQKFLDLIKDDLVGINSPFEELDQ